MKRNLLYTLVLLFVANLAFGQITINPKAIEFNTNGEDQITNYIDITNATGSDIDLYWEFIPAESYPEEWVTQICDINLCYAPNALKSSPGAPNVLTDGMTVEFSFKIWDNDGSLQGNSFGILNLYDDPEFTNLVASSSAPVTSTNNIDINDLVIYPNPTTEFIQLKNDASIANIRIFNIVGRMVKTFNHASGMVHDVTTLRSGMYLVRLEDKDGDVVKSMRLSKK